MRFLLVDEILELVPGKSFRARKFVAPDEDYFRDHFPGFPVVPGVLLTEMMAQAAGKCLDAESPERGRSMLAQIESARFLHWVRPGSTAFVRGEVTMSRAQFAKARCEVEVDSQTVATAALFFVFVPRSEFTVEPRDEILERFLAGPGRSLVASPGSSDPGADPGADPEAGPGPQART